MGVAPRHFLRSNSTFKTLQKLCCYSLSKLTLPSTAFFSAEAVALPAVRVFCCCCCVCFFFFQVDLQLNVVRTV